MFEMAGHDVKEESRSLVIKKERIGSIMSYIDKHIYECVRVFVSLYLYF